MPAQSTTTSYGAPFAAVETNPDGNAALAARLYLAVLGRPHDGLGLGDATAFLNGGGSTAALANRLAASPEFTNRAASLSNADFVQSAYNAALGRTASQPEIDFYVAQITAGGSRAAVGTAIAASPESRQAFADAYPAGVEYPDPLSITVARFYDAAFNRAPEAEGLAFWRSQLASGALTEDNFADALAGSPEFTGRTAGQTNADVVSVLYSQALGRAASSAEVDYYASRLASGALTRGDLVQAFANAPEQIAGFSSSVSGGVNDGASVINPPPGGNASPVVATPTVSGTVAENDASGAVIATTTITDPEGATLAYSVTDARFDVNASGGLSLATGTALNFEALSANPITVTVSATDGVNPAVTQDVVLTVTNVNEAPVAAPASVPVTVPENTFGAPIGTVAFTDQDAGDTLTYAVTGVLTNTATPFFTAADFEVVGTTLQLVAGQALDRELPYDVANTITVTVTATDAGGLTATQDFVVTISDTNDGPFGLALSNSSIAENSAAGTVVGALTTQDGDLGETFTYALSGTSAANFGVDATTGNLVVAPGAVLDFETLSALPITVTATDSRGATTSQNFTIVLTDVASQATAVADFYPLLSGDPGVSSGAPGLLNNDTNAVSAVAGSLVGDFGGILNLNADGSFNYSSPGPLPPGASEVFTYAVLDVNGEAAQGTARFDYF